MYSCMEPFFCLTQASSSLLKYDNLKVYTQVLYICLSVSSNEDVMLAVSCMDKMMRKRRQVMRY